MQVRLTTIPKETPVWDEINLGIKKSSECVYFEIAELANWNAVVCFDLRQNEAVAVKSDVVGLKDATLYVREYLRRK